MSECQPLPAYQTRAIYFVQIRVSSLFTHCLCFYFWSFISFTYTRSLFFFCLMLLFVSWRRYTQAHAARGCNGLGKKYTTLLMLFFLRSFYDTALCSKACFYCISHWLNLHTTWLPVQIGAIVVTWQKKFEHLSLIDFVVRNNSSSSWQGML